MKRKMKKCLCVLTAIAVLLGGVQIPALKAQENTQTVRSGAVTVYSREEFMNALQQKKSPITVPTNIVIGNEADASGRMRPVKIPAGTIIQGNGGVGTLVSRAPIQLEGDGVVFKDIKLHLESSDALGSVPHREIYLAGHSLTLDNVDTYLEGGAELGGFGGTEKELLPVIYAGGYPGSSVGSKASLTVKNSNDKTILRAVYMGHGTENNNHVSYQGEAELNLDAKATVREEVNTSQNSRALITMGGKQYSFARAKKFVGNENTTLTLDTVSITEAEIKDVGNIVLKNKACLTPKTESLRNVTLESGACLDFTGVDQAEISGNFIGTAEGAERGIFVLKPEGTVSINGNVEGVTQFQTGHKAFPGALVTDHPYISAPNGSESNFVLAQKSIEAGFELIYSDGIWKGYKEPEEERSIGHIEVLEAPSKVDIQKLSIAEQEEPNENIYFTIKWYDKKGEVFSAEDIKENLLFYDIGQVIRIRTDYWESDDPTILDNEDWVQWVTFVPSEKEPDRYYLQSCAGKTILVGEYTFLFLSDPVDGDLDTVGDVKALKDTVLREEKVVFYDSSVTGEEEEHIHKYAGSITVEATCMTEGVMTYTCTHSGCGESYTEKVSTSEHKFQENVMQKATCTEPGVMIYQCICGIEYAEEIPAPGHTEVIDPEVPPTDTENGKTQGSHCGVCNTVLKPQETIPATGKPTEPENPGTPGTPQIPGSPAYHTHAYQSNITTMPTCTVPGVRTFVCKCGNTYTEEIPVTDHQYMEKCIPATMNGDGEIQQICSVCSAVGDVTMIDRIQSVSLSRTDYTYDGKAKKPSIVIKDAKGRQLAEGTDYQASYAKGRIHPGVYKVSVTFKGKYSGQTSETFTIRPKKTELKNVVPGSKSIKVLWKKNTSKIDGYQIQYSTDKNFKNSATKATTAKKSAVSKKISKLKSGKKYYVRIRTYKIVQTGGKSKKLYSDWSDKKNVYIKK